MYFRAWLSCRRYRSLLFLIGLAVLSSIYLNIQPQQPTTCNGDCSQPECVGLDMCRAKPPQAKPLKIVVKMKSVPKEGENRS